MVINLNIFHHQRINHL